MNVHLETPIAASADDVWQKLGREFAQIEDWSTVVRTSRAIGTDEVPEGLTVAPEAPVPGRETTTRVTLIEVLTEYSDADRRLTFEGVGLPPIVRRALNTNSVRATGSASSVVVFDVQMDFRGPFGVLAPLMKRRMRKTFGEVQRDLKAHVEGVARGSAATVG